MFGCLYLFRLTKMRTITWLATSAPIPLPFPQTKRSPAATFGWWWKQTSRRVSGHNLSPSPWVLIQRDKQLDVCAVCRLKRVPPGWFTYFVTISLSLSLPLPLFTCKYSRILHEAFRSSSRPGCLVCVLPAGQRRRAAAAAAAGSPIPLLCNRASRDSGSTSAKWCVRSLAGSKTKSPSRWIDSRRIETLRRCM